MPQSCLTGVVLILFTTLVEGRLSGARQLLVQSFSASDKPVTVPFNTSLQPGSEDLPFDDARVVKKIYGTAPEQVHLTYVSPSEMIVTYVTGSAQMGGDMSGTNASGTVPTFVRYSARSGGPYQNATGSSKVYQQIYTFVGFPNINYTSPLIHHVRLTGLEPRTTYYYIAGDPIFGTTEEITFTTMGPVGSFPLRLGLLGDLGITYNSSTTLNHLIANEVEMVLFVGDCSYADAWMTNGTLAPYMRNSPATPYPPSIVYQVFGTFQPKWDMWGRFTEPLFSKVAMNSIPGNHDVEPQFLGEFKNSNVKQVSWETRYPVPYKESGSKSPSYYSYDIGGVHVIGLSSYIPHDRKSAQYKWLEADLRKVNRSVTPWVIALSHAPWYNSYSSHYMEVECQRQAMEPLLYRAGVDVMFHGHVHAYERTFPVNDYKRGDCGLVHVTIGDGGNVEKLYRNYSDQAGLCPSPGKVPFYQPEYCEKFPYPGGPNKGFCTTEQPQWSAYREPSFGHGILVVENATHAVWEWHRNQDASDVISDKTVIVRNGNCVDRAFAPEGALSDEEAPSDSAAIDARGEGPIYDGALAPAPGALRGNNEGEVLIFDGTPKGALFDEEAPSNNTAFNAEGNVMIRGDDLAPAGYAVRGDIAPNPPLDALMPPNPTANLPSAPAMDSRSGLNVEVADLAPAPVPHNSMRPPEGSMDAPAYSA